MSVQTIGGLSVGLSFGLLAVNIPGAVLVFILGYYLAVKGEQ